MSNSDRSGAGTSSPGCFSAAANHCCASMATELVNQAAGLSLGLHQPSFGNYSTRSPFGAAFAGGLQLGGLDLGTKGGGSGGLDAGASDSEMFTSRLSAPSSGASSSSEFPVSSAAAILSCTASACASGSHRLTTSQALAANGSGGSNSTHPFAAEAHHNFGTNGFSSSNADSGANGGSPTMLSPQLSASPKRTGGNAQQHSPPLPHSSTAAPSFTHGSTAMAVLPHSSSAMAGLAASMPASLASRLSSSPGSGNHFPAYNLQQPSVAFYAAHGMGGARAGGALHGGDMGFQRGGAMGGGSAPVDMPTLNLNKAITKRLANATHYQQILDIISDSAGYFDEVNVATALHRLARLQCMSASSSAATVIVTSQQFKLLLLSIQKLLPRFEAQAVSNTAWALATLAYLPDASLLQELADRATAIISTFRPQATSNTLWAFAKLGVTPPESFMEAAATQMTHDLSRSVPQDISNTLWAYATLRYSPGSALLRGAAAHAVQCMPRFKPQEVANTLWSYATLGLDPGAQLLDAIAAHMCDRMHAFRPQAVSNSLWAYAKLRYNPGRELLEAAGRRATAALHQYTPQELGNTLWAIAVLEHHPGPALLDAAAAHVLRRLQHFGPADTSNSLWAYARLFHYPGSDLLQAVGLHALRQWHRFRAAEATNLVWALAILKAPAPELWGCLLEKLALAPLASFDDADLQQLYQAYLLLDPSIKRIGAVAPSGAFPHALLEDAEARWKATVRAPGHSSGLCAAVSRCLWSMNIGHSVQHLTSDGLFCVDIALDDEQVIIEVDGPDNFCSNSHRPLGRTVGRRCMLEACGYIVRSIVFYEWNSMDAAAQQAYLTRLLASAYL